MISEIKRSRFIQQHSILASHEPTTLCWFHYVNKESYSKCTVPVVITWFSYCFILQLRIGIWYISFRVITIVYKSAVIITFKLFRLTVRSAPYSLHHCKLMWWLMFICVSVSVCVHARDKESWSNIPVWSWSGNAIRANWLSSQGCNAIV